MAYPGAFLPKILLAKNSAIDISTAETYRNFVIIYICGVPGVMLGALMYAIPRIGRKWVSTQDDLSRRLLFFLTQPRPLKGHADADLGHGRIFGSYGHITLPLRNSQHRGFKYRIKCNGT